MLRWLLVIGLSVATVGLTAQRVVKIATVVTDFDQGLLLIDGYGFGEGPLVLLTGPAAAPNAKRGIVEGCNSQPQRRTISKRCSLRTAAGHVPAECCERRLVRRRDRRHVRAVGPPGPSGPEGLLLIWTGYGLPGRQTSRGRWCS